MIAKCKAISHGSNALEYVFREGKLGRILALHNLCSETPKEIHEEMRLIGDYNSRCKNKFLRIEIGIAPKDEPQMTFKALNRLALLFAKQLSHIQTDIRKFKDLINTLVIIIIPCFLIILQPDPGSTLVYGAFIFALNREGMSSSFIFLMLLFLMVFLSTLKFGMGNTITFFVFLALLYGYWAKQRNGHTPYRHVSLLVILCVLTSYSANFIFYNVFKQHHRDRFSLWLRLDNEITDSQTLRQTVAYNTLQAESAISSGGLSGKGFLEGTLTKGDFVPEQHTDYIFTTLGEEWGFYGTATVTLLFALLCLRIWYLAENQRSKFYRIYGYCVSAIFFIHFFVNISMVIGTMPTVGIPLPFFSYGGSGLWGFTMLLFIFLRLNMNKEKH